MTQEARSAAQDRCPSCGGDAGNNAFDRSICPEPCGSMHTRCVGCGTALDGCSWESQNDPAAASTPPEIKHLPPEPMESRERTLHFWLARLTAYPRWVSIGSIDNYAELPRVSREDYETIQAVLRGE